MHWEDGAAELQRPVDVALLEDPWMAVLDPCVECGTLAEWFSDVDATCLVFEADDACCEVSVAEGDGQGEQGGA